MSAAELLEGESASTLDFVMVNPPFYSDEEQAAKVRDDGRSRTTFTSSESVCPGGEVGFVHRLVKESVGGRCAGERSAQREAELVRAFPIVTRRVYLPVTFAIIDVQRVYTHSIHMLRFQCQTRLCS